jgi:transposase-like protein
MAERKHRKFTAEEKIQILKEAEQPGTTIAQVCRKHGLAPSVFYAWRAVSQKAAGDALKKSLKSHGKPDAEVERLKAELTRMRAVVSEITAENLELKKKL